MGVDPENQLMIITGGAAANLFEKMTEVASDDHSAPPGPKKDAKSAILSLRVGDNITCAKIAAPPQKKAPMGSPAVAPIVYVCASKASPETGALCAIDEIETALNSLQKNQSLDIPPR